MQLVTSVTAASIKHPFIEGFLAASTVSQAEKTDDKIRKCLHRLHKAGCAIDSSHVVFDSFGHYWPQIRTSTNRSISCGLVIGTPGSFGIGSCSLASYLESLSHQVMTESTSDRPSLVNAAQPAPLAEKPACSSVSSREENIVAPVVVDESPDITLLLLINNCAGATNVPWTYSLETLRSNLGLFTKDPEGELNDLSLEEILGTKLRVYPDGKYLIQRDDVVLASSEGLRILPRGPKGYFVHGASNFSDNPCEESQKLLMPLRDRAKVATLLPYLRAIPRCTS